jgi:hypothetical protein
MKVVEHLLQKGKRLAVGEEKGEKSIVGTVDNTKAQNMHALELSMKLVNM